jgi:hypothetical protein
MLGKRSAGPRFFAGVRREKTSALFLEKRRLYFQKNDDGKIAAPVRPPSWFDGRTLRVLLTMRAS